MSRKWPVLQAGDLPHRGAGPHVSASPAARATQTCSPGPGASWAEPLVGAAASAAPYRSNTSPGGRAVAQGPPGVRAL